MLTVLLMALFIWNLFVFLAYGYDKIQAIKGGWRISERFLLTITFFLGGLGALIGGKLCHHKTQKWYFVWSWWLGILLILGMIVFILFLQNV
ncbi:DUF1294 domain-containing protein [Streptococcus pluranimalium]|uniref:DUF1294 domain-containing protein n=1 Tax=Streptococcus pluranimalium TaxID=82348 RepID=A0A2L0D2V6_9STRE|nr:DUF1294 domain-containing protein [Streptococcus pluranimalium]AUW96158.1 DUF1294 domain-containing protein [Streptococcus pluranimalium]